MVKWFQPCACDADFIFHLRIAFPAVVTTRQKDKQANDLSLFKVSVDALQDRTAFDRVKTLP
jgi:hypothetical protein